VSLLLFQACPSLSGIFSFHSEYNKDISHLSTLIFSCKNISKTRTVLYFVREEYFFLKPLYRLSFSKQHQRKGYYYAYILCTHKLRAPPCIQGLFMVQSDPTVLHIAPGHLIFRLYTDILLRLKRGEKIIVHSDGDWLLRYVNHDSPL
jgi:hypothetical protein